MCCVLKSSWSWQNKILLVVMTFYWCVKLKKKSSNMFTNTQSTFPWDTGADSECFGSTCFWFKYHYWQTRCSRNSPKNILVLTNLTYFILTNQGLNKVNWLKWQVHFKGPLGGRGGAKSILIFIIVPPISSTRRLTSWNLECTFWRNVR